MNIFVLTVFIAGVVTGLSFGLWWGRRKAHVSIFESDSEETKEIRAEGARAVRKRIEKRKEKILEKAKVDGRITNNGVEDLFCISDRTAGNYLRELVKEGKLNKIGTSGRGVYYTPNNI
jgi:predicted HTH transcriptional regulator